MLLGGLGGSGARQVMDVPDEDRVVPLVFVKASCQLQSLQTKQCQQQTTSAAAEADDSSVVIDIPCIQSNPTRMNPREVDECSAMCKLDSSEANLGDSGAVSYTEKFNQAGFPTVVPLLRGMSQVAIKLLFETWCW